MLAAVELGIADLAKSKSGREKTIREAVKAVSELLGNTPAVCRSSYIDPRVLDRYRNGGHRIKVPTNWQIGSSPRTRSLIEKRVRELVQGK